MYCWKQDDDVTTRTGFATVDLSEDLDMAGSYKSTIYYKVDCGVRSKLMICPVSNGMVQQCAVKKSCSPYVTVTPRAASSADRNALWTDTGDTIPAYGLDRVLIDHPIWPILLENEEFQAQVHRTCALNCGFF